MVRNNWQRATHKALFEHNRRTCEICHQNAATDPHHAIVKTDKNRTSMDAYWNLEMVCRACHQDIAHTKAHKPEAIRTILKYSTVEDILNGLDDCEAEGSLIDEQRRLVISLTED